MDDQTTTFAATAATTATTTGCTANDIDRSCSCRFALLSSYRCTADIEGTAKILEAGCLDGQGIVTYFVKMIGAVGCIDIVIQHKGILANQEIVINFVQGHRFATWLGQYHTFNRVYNAIQQIANFKMQIAAGFRCFLDL